MKYIIALLSVLMVSTCIAQSDDAEAKAKLAAKEAKRLTDRQQNVQITAGELSDLHLKISKLEGEINVLKTQLNQRGKSNRVLSNMIEIGMTKQEVIDFVKRNKNMRITAMSADTGVRRSSDQVIIKGQSQTNGNGNISSNSTGSTTVTENGNDPKTISLRNKAKVSINENENVNINKQMEVETVHNSGMHESIQIEQSTTVRKIVGSTGGRSPEDIYNEITSVTGHINVSLTDGLVTSVNAGQQ
jgi:hypothetical protein